VKLEAEKLRGSEAEKGIILGRGEAGAVMLSQKKLKDSMRREADVVEEPVRPRGRPLWEYFVLFPVLAISVYSTAYLFSQQVEHYRQIMLRQQLWQIRNAIIIFHVLNTEMPPDLASLAHTTVEDARGRISFPLLEGVVIDQDGRVIDPLGYPYKYDSRTGKVTSQAPCCQYW